MKILKFGEFALINTNVPDSAYPLWDETASYVAGDVVYVEDNHGEYKAIADNSGTHPLDNPDKWTWLGTTNRWRMFDQYLNTATVNVGSIEIEISAYGAGGLFLGNILGTELYIEVIDAASGEIIESVQEVLIADPGDWEEYFFGTWIDEYKRSFFYERKTLTRDCIYKIRLTNGDSDAQIGIFAIGQTDKTGCTLWNVDVSALDFSTVVTDTNTGATFLQQGNYVKTMQVDIYANTSGIDVIYRKLTEIRGTPVVFIGGVYDTLTVFGFVKKFETLLKGPRETIITIDLQGLI